MSMFFIVTHILRNTLSLLTNIKQRTLTKIVLSCIDKESFSEQLPKVYKLMCVTLQYPLSYD